MDIDLKSAGLGAGAGACLVGLIWLGKKLFTKKVVADSTPKWDQMRTMFDDMFKHSTKDNLSDDVKLMKEIVDSNMPASLIKEAGEEVGITFTGERRKDMIAMVCMKGSDGVAAIKSKYEKWKNGEFSKEKTSETKENDSEAQTTENKTPESKESEE